MAGVSGPRPARVKVTWLGHATVLLETPGARVITDPVLRRRVAHLSRQVQNPDHPGPVDVVLLSHLHHDHFDKPSLRRLASPRPRRRHQTSRRCGRGKCNTRTRVPASG